MTNEITPTDDETQMTVFLDFVDAMQAAQHPEHVVRDYIERYPQWRRAFLKRAVLLRLFSQAQADRLFPDLQELTDFDIRRQVAVGGMGVVYEAVQRSLDRRVALKVCYGRTSPEREERFRQEQRVLAKLHQSNIVPIYASGSTKQWQYFVMAYIDGVSLAQLLPTVRDYWARQTTIPKLADLVRDAQQQSPTQANTERLTHYAADIAGQTRLRTPTPAAPPTPLPPAERRPLALTYIHEIVDLLSAIGTAVEHAHQAGVLHRDLKPSNMLVDTRGQSWLIDFGLADQVQPTTDEGVTRSLAGTPAYMAPEQVSQQHPASVATDVWSFGVTLYEMLALRRPYEGATLAEMHAPLATPPAPLTQWIPNIPADLAAIVAKTLRHEPHDRYASLGEVVADLRRWRAGFPTHARPLWLVQNVWRWCLRHRSWATALALGLLLFVSVTALYLIDAKARVAEVEFEREILKAQAAHEQALLQRQQREGWLLEMEHRDIGLRQTGWFTKARTLAIQASTVQQDATLRDRFVTTLKGWDATLLHEWPWATAHVAVDPKQERLLLAGLNDPQGAPQFPNALLTFAGQQRQEWTSTNEGPVAFGPTGTPLQLQYQAQQLVVMNLAENKQEHRWALPLPPGTEVRADDVTLALSPEGRYAAASATWGHDQGAAWLWDVATQRVLAQVNEPVEAFAFHDTSYLGWAEARSRQVVVRSLPDAKVVAEFAKGSLPVRCMTFGKNVRRSDASPPGPVRPLLALGDAGGVCTVWNTATRQHVNTLRTPQREIYALAFNRDGTTLVAGGRGPLYLFDVAAGQAQLVFQPPSGIDYIMAVQFLHDDQQLLLSSRGVFYKPQTSLWSLQRERGWRTFAGLTSPCDRLVLSPDEKTLAVLTQNWEIGLWDVASGALRAIIEPPPGAFGDNCALVFSPDSKRLAYSAGAATQGHVREYDVNTGQRVRQWTLPPGLQNEIAYTPQGSMHHFQVEAPSAGRLPTSDISASMHPRVGILRDLNTTEPTAIRHRFTIFDQHVHEAKVDRHGRYLALEGLGAKTPNSVALFDLATGVERWRHEQPDSVKRGNFEFNSDSTALYFSVPRAGRATPEGMNNLLHVADGRTTPSDDPLAVTRQLSGYAYAKWYQDRLGCYVWGAETEPVLNLGATRAIASAVFSVDGRWLYLAGLEGGVSAVHLPTLNEALKPLGLHWPTPHAGQ